MLLYYLLYISDREKQITCKGDIFVRLCIYIYIYIYYVCYKYIGDSANWLAVW